MSVHETVELIDTREDLVAFIEQLRSDHEDHPEGSGDRDLASYLAGLAARRTKGGDVTNRGIDSEDMPVSRSSG